jgi:hypothetical protein
MAKAKEGIGVKTFKVTKNRRRSLPKHLRHSKSLGPKSDMKRDRGRR